MSTQTFKLLSEADTPTVIGKAWWNESVGRQALAAAAPTSTTSRRDVLVIAGAIGAFFVLPPMCATCGDDDGDGDDGTRRERRRALQLQREQGWLVGAADDPVARAPAAVPVVVDATVFAPKNPALTPFYVPTLFDSLAAVPTAASAEDIKQWGLRPVRDFAQPSLAGSGNGLHEGQVLADVIGARSNVAIVVDLPGAEAVAFASRLAAHHDPVFLFDNWPHPRGVVRADQTLAAALALSEPLAAAKKVRPANAPPVFVLDRTRLTPSVDEANQFDNRWTARLPDAASLRAIGITRVFYVAPEGQKPVELDDVVDDLLAYVGAGIEVRAYLVPSVSPPSTSTSADGKTVNRVTSLQYAYGFPTSEPPSAVAVPVPGADWSPARRTSPYSAHQQPSGFGEVPVVLSAAGIVLGAALYRNGSWNRVSSSSSYFGGG